jgi:pimeloyl-ACP methyl ester carboxylesterase
VGTGQARASDGSLEFSGLRHREVEANGLLFHVAECGEGDRLALCLHGFPECWISWRHQMPLLADLGWRVWAPDLRGYGGSEKPGHMNDYAIEVLMADVAGLIDASGAREVLLLAHDWGGVIAWYFAMRRLRPLEGLVVMNLPHPGAAARAFRRPRQLLRSWYALFFQIPRLPERILAANRGRLIGRAFVQMAVHPERFPGDVLEAFREAALVPGAPKAMIDYYRAFLRGGGARRQQALGFPEIDVPTLLLWGERDAALGRETTYGTENFVTDLTLRYLPDASHWVQQDQPELVNEMLGAWLRGQPVPQAPGTVR